MAGNVSDDEAAWRELIARFSTATADGAEPAPWPAREDLTVPPRPAAPDDPVMGPLTRPPAPCLPGREAEQEPGSHPDPEADPGPAGPDGRGAEPGHRPAGPGSGQAGQSRARIVRPALPGFLPGPASPAGTGDDDHFVPPPPPPLPPLDPVAKGAWAALFGGPAYLLLAVMAGWAIPGWAAFCAVAAFIGGFATLVVRMGDQPRDSGPDNGAVV